MRALAFLLALIAGCGAMQEHPFATVTVVNSTAVVAASACALECGNSTARGVSDGVLITELAATSSLAWMFGAWLVYEATGDER